MTVRHQAKLAVGKLASITYRTDKGLRSDHMLQVHNAGPSSLWVTTIPLKAEVARDLFIAYDRIESVTIQENQ